MLRFVMLLILQFDLELQLAIDTGEKALAHIVYNQRIYIPIQDYNLNCHKQALSLIRKGILSFDEYNFVEYCQKCYKA